LEKPLLLIEKSDVFPDAVGLAEEALAHDGQSPIAQFRPDAFVRIPVCLVPGEKHGMNDVRQYFVDPGLAEQVDWPSGRTGGERKMAVPKRVRQSAEPLADFLESRRD
jgi:hypothetical protein